MTCTAMASGILQHPCQHHAREHRSEAQQIVAEGVRYHQRPLPLLKVGHGFECITGESSECAAESHHNQQAPARINEHAFAGPDDEEADDQAAGDIDDECAVRKHRAKKLGGVTANDPAGIGANNCANGDDHKVAHDGVLLFRVGVISLASAGRLWRTPSPPSFLPQRAQGSTERRTGPDTSCESSRSARLLILGYEARDQSSILAFLHSFCSRGLRRDDASVLTLGS